MKQKEGKEIGKSSKVEGSIFLHIFLSSSSSLLNFLFFLFGRDVTFTC